MVIYSLDFSSETNKTPPKIRSEAIIRRVDIGSDKNKKPPIAAIIGTSS